MSDPLLTQDEIDALLGVITQPVTSGPPSSAVPVDNILNPDEVSTFQKFIDDVFVGGQEAFSNVISASTRIKVKEIAESKKSTLPSHYQNMSMYQYYLDIDGAIKGRGAIYMRDTDAFLFGDILLGGDGTSPTPDNKEQYGKAIEECFKRFCDTYLKAKLTGLAGGMPLSADISRGATAEFKDGYDSGLGNDLVGTKLSVEVTFNGDKNRLNFELFLCMPIGLAQDIISLIGQVMLSSKQPEAPQVTASASQSLLITNQDEIDAILNQVSTQQPAAPAPQPVQQPIQQPQQMPQMPQQPMTAQVQQQPMMGQQQGFPPQQQPMMGQQQGFPPQQQFMQQPMMGQQQGFPPQQQFMQQPMMGQMGYPPQQQFMQQPPQPVIFGQQVPPQNVQPVKFAPLNMGSPAGAASNIELLLDVPLTLTVELGRTKMLIKDILELTAGSIIELDKIAGESIDVLINNKLVAKGEVVVIDENFGIRITNIISPHERLQSIK